MVRRGSTSEHVTAHEVFGMVSYEGFDQMRAYEQCFYGDGQFPSEACYTSIRIRGPHPQIHCLLWTEKYLDRDS